MTPEEEFIYLWCKIRDNKVLAQQSIDGRPKSLNWYAKSLEIAELLEVEYSSSNYFQTLATKHAHGPKMDTLRALAGPHGKAIEAMLRARSKK